MLKKLTTAQFIERASKKHENFYNYSLVDYKNQKTNINISCPIHGQFFQRPDFHLKGSNCPKCAHSSEKVIENIKKINPNKLILGTLTLKQAISGQQTPNNKYTRVRNSARHTFKKELKEMCQICGYGKHVELCHIKSISTFNEDTLLQEINSPENVMFLCPNCHWEFDNGLIVI